MANAETPRRKPASQAPLRLLVFRPQLKRKVAVGLRVRRQLLLA
ncbi:MAG: hypothetical protein ABSE73_08645 [Planctomycetota bacterium]